MIGFFRWMLDVVQRCNVRCCSKQLQGTKISPGTCLSGDHTSWAREATSYCSKSNIGNTVHILVMNI